MNKQYIFYIWFLTLLSFAGEAQQTVSGTLTHDNVVRNYRLRLPKDHQKTEAIPLVFNFHGFSSNAGQQEFYSGMNTLADKEKFAVCYPNGINAAWNVGWSFGSTADDVGFVEAMIEKFVVDYGFDRNKIYACGMSNGGFFSYHLACNLSNKIAAIASVTGSMVPGTFEKCTPSSSIPVMEIHGTADDVVAYGGTTNISLSVDSVITFWSNHNQCVGPFLKENLPNTNSNDQSTVEKYVYKDCDTDREVWLYKVLGGGHTWPGAIISIGVTNQDINANEEIWKFFKRFSLPKTNSISEQNESTAIFPNPAFDKINLAYKDVHNVQIFNAFGRLVLEDFYLSPGQTLDILNLPKGMYILTCQADGKPVVHKFIKM